MATTRRRSTRKPKTHRFAPKDPRFFLEPKAGDVNGVLRLIKHQIANSKALYKVSKVPGRPKMLRVSYKGKHVDFDGTGGDGSIGTAIIEGGYLVAKAKGLAK